VQVQAGLRGGHVGVVRARGRLQTRRRRQ
jgi:hypothetical protein